MKGSLKQALSIGLMATFVLPANLPVSAADAVGTNGASTSVSSEKTLERSQAPITARGPYDEIDQRMVIVERRILEGLSSGRLNSVQAAEVKKQLDAVIEVEAQFRSEPSKFTHWQIVRLHSLLDKVSALLEVNMGDRDLAGADLEFAKVDLLKRIDLAALHGRLSAAEVANVKQRYNRIVALETALRRRQGRLTYADKLLLHIDFDHLAHEIRRQMGERTLTLPEVAKAAANLEIKIAEGLKAGTISETQTEDFRKKLNDLKAIESDLQKNGRSGDREQQIALGVSTEEIANSIARLMQKEALPTIDSRLIKLDHRLAQGLDGGELSPLETMELKEDLDELIAAKVSLSTAGATTTAEAIQTLNLAVARLESRIDRQIHGPSRVWPGMTVLLTHLGMRSKEALAAKRLNEDEAKAFRMDIGKLAANKLQLEKSAEGLNSAQALSLAEDIQRMGARLEKTMKDREMAVPNIDALNTAINNRIAEATIAGDLSTGEARASVLKLAETNLLKERYRTTENQLTNREIFNVAYELERLSANTEEQIHGHAPFFPGFDTRRAQIEALIGEGISSGRLNTAEAVLLKTNLEETNKLERQYRLESTGLTAEKALELIGNLEREWQDLDRQLREQEVMISDLVSLEGAVEKKMRQGFSYGLLTLSEVESLRSSYDAVVNAFNKMRASDGGLSYGERLAFSFGFERLNANVERQMREVPLPTPSIEAQRAQVEQKLGSMLASGRLPVQEAQDIKSLLDEIIFNSHVKRRSGGGISYQESIIISTDLDRLNQRVELRAAALKSPLPDIDAKQAELERKISESLSKGGLSSDDAKDLKSELERVATAEAAFRISDESLNYAEAINLVMDLERIKTRLNNLNARKMSAAPEKNEKTVHTPNKAAKSTSPAKSQKKK